MNQLTKRLSELETEITAFAALCGLGCIPGRSESPLDTGLHARFVHRVIAYAVREALTEQPHYPEVLLSRILWSYPDFRVCADDIAYVLRRLEQNGVIQFTEGEYMLAKPDSIPQGVK